MVLIYLFHAILRGMVLLIDVNLNFPTGSKVRFDDQFKCRLRLKKISAIKRIRDWGIFESPNFVAICADVWRTRVYFLRKTTDVF